MSRLTRPYIAMTLAVATLASGCKPIQPFYLGEKEDLAHYIQVATDLEYPDVHEASLAESVMAEPPLMLSNPQPRELWDLTLEEAMQISLHNSKVLKRIGGVRGTISTILNGTSANVAPPSTQLRDRVLSPDSVQTIYGPALQETNTFSTATQGVESALAAFDAQLSSSLFWDRTRRPENAPAFGAIPSRTLQDQMVFQAEIAKQNATGGQVAFRNNTIYTEPTPIMGAFGRPTLSDWLTNFEAEVRQPLLRGRGTQVNRIPVVLARIRTDVSLADFECAVRDHVRDLENTYWETYFAYRALEAAKARRDSVHHIWRATKNLQLVERRGGETQKEALARQEYYQAKASVEAALVDLFQIENRLRFMMGLAPTDGRLIRPISEPLNTNVAFDWHHILNESLCRSCEVRIKRWHIKQREMELIAARNNLLPQLDAFGLYRWLGRGDELLNYEDGPFFGQPGDVTNSDAFEQLFRGDFQEWQLGFEFTMPVGLRREMAAVRHQQLQLARERAILQETELEVVHALTDRVQRADAAFTLAETNFNRKVATEKEVEAYAALIEESVGEGTQNLEFFLNSITRNANAQVAFYRALVDHTVMISEIHAIKGSLLEYNNVMLAEGPWPAKAYYDAHHLARQRAAGHYIDYGYTRPQVISRGTYEQFQHGVPLDGNLHLHQEAQPNNSGEPIETPTPIPPDQSTSVDQPPAARLQVAIASQPEAVTASTSGAVTPASAEADAATSQSGSASPASAPAGSVEIRVRNGAKFNWGEMGGLQE